MFDQLWLVLQCDRSLVSSLYWDAAFIVPVELNIVHLTFGKQLFTVSKVINFKLGLLVACVDVNISVIE